MNDPMDYLWGFMLGVPLCIWLVYLLMPKELRLPYWYCDRCDFEWRREELVDECGCPYCGEPCVEVS